MRQNKNVDMCIDLQTIFKLSITVKSFFLTKTRRTIRQCHFQEGLIAFFGSPTYQRLVLTFKLLSTEQKILWLGSTLKN